ncbi:MAG: MG2 domain-containing protein [Bacteroidota bacterium]
MNKKTIIIGAATVLAFGLITYFVFANKQANRKADPAFREYILSFTSGTISREANIRIQLMADVAQPGEVNTTIKTELFDFSPSIEGRAVWVDSRTIEFRPSEKLEPGKEYAVVFKLGEVMKVPEKFKLFEFGFAVMKQSFEVEVEGLRPLDKRQFDRQVLYGNISTADAEDVEKVQDILKAEQQGRKLPVRWVHNEKRTVHAFFVDSIIRGADSSTVTLSWNGKAIDVDSKGERTITVPALGDFSFTRATVSQSESEQYILLQFSDPIDEKQNLQGLITLGGPGELRFMIEDNTIRVYPGTWHVGTYDLFVVAAVRNVLGKQLKEDIKQDIVFEEIKPSVRLTGKGVILPSSNGLMLPFEAVSLNAIDVRVVKIFENNVQQFLQVNTLGGENEITRVGRVVLKKKVPLSSIKQTDITKWNQYALDLSELMKVDQGAIYRVTISFKKKYAVYKCFETDTTTAPEENTEANEDAWDDLSEKESSSWDYVEDYYDEDGNYNWSQRENPCKSSYYNSSRWVSRNILASDLGLIAKKGAEGSMLFAVTDLKTTVPQFGVNLEVYNLQRQLIQRAVTDNNGLAEVKLDKKPYLLVAKKGTQRGYLKLDDGSSLSLSMFDVAGEKVQKGIKGFIYGERGVWRPGDSLFLTFILEDKQKILPASYPVSFELFNPRSQLTKKLIKTESTNGFYSFITKTDEEAPTGSWEARVKVGNAVFSKTLRIETVMPNRLKIKFDFAGKYLSKDKNESAQMEVRWLTGAAARNLKVTVDVNLVASKTAFPKYSEFIFDDPTRKFYSDKQVLFENEIDANGKAMVTADIKVEDAAPGMLQANFVTKAFEPGGNFSVDRFSMPYHPYDVYTGIRLPKGDKARGMLLTDTNHAVQIVSVDRNGAPAATTRKIEIEFYKVQWKWWWDKSEENSINYNSTSYNQFLQRDTITTTNGEGKWMMRLNYPNWGRYFLKARDLSSGHTTGKVFYMDWPGWAGRAQKDMGSSATMLSFTSDKEKYVVGEQATLTIPMGKSGRALISVESGTKVLKTYWLEGMEGEAQFKIPVTPDMAPNVYVNVTLLQPHAQTINDLPIRMYGIIPIQVENPNTHLKPIIKMDDVLQPLEHVNLTVSEEKGKAMTYTIAVVDEGLLDLTRFQTPDPWNAFYAREAHGVKTWDMFDDVIGAWGARLERILAIGGDEGMNKPKEGKKANRFKPVVKFMGPFHLEKGETRAHKFTMPQYVGAVRTMVVAGEDAAYGFAEKSTPVRKPLMVLATLPRVLAPGESVDLPVTLFAMENHVKDVKVEITSNSLIVVDGEKAKSLTFSQPGDEILNFKLKVKDAEVIDTVLDAGKNWKVNYKAIGIAGTNKVTLEVSTIPSLNLGKRLNYLIHYPHGCVEQTTSSVFPQLYLTDLMDLPPAQKTEIEKHIKAGIERLKLFQLSSGAMTYWPGENEVNEWATNYAGHFIIEAELKGYSLPNGFLDQWKKYQRNKATTWSSSDDESANTQAYRLYTLALAKSPELGSMNRLKENKNLPPLALWNLASAYQLAGQPEVANQLTANLPLTVKDYRDLSGTYGSDERDEAIILESLSLMGKREKATYLVKEISAALCNNQWMSTQTTSYSLLAISKYAGKSGTKAEMNFAYQFNASQSQTVATQSLIKQVNAKVKGTENGIASVTNTGRGILYARIISEGIPKIGDVTSSRSEVDMKVEYKDMDDKEIDHSHLEQGKDFYVQVSVTNPGNRGDYAEMALTQIFPSGWEILNTRLDGGENVSGLSVPRYQDIRDDRVNTFFDLKVKETKTFRVYLNSSYLGDFYLPAVYTEAMYDASINAVQAGKWIKVGSGTQEKKLTSSK